MSFGVDTLGGLSEKLKQLVNETQDIMNIIDDNTLQKGKLVIRIFRQNCKIHDFPICTKFFSH